MHAINIARFMLLPVPPPSGGAYRRKPAEGDRTNPPPAGGDSLGKGAGEAGAGVVKRFGRRLLARTRIPYNHGVVTEGGPYGSRAGRLDRPARYRFRVRALAGRAINEMTGP